MKQRRKNRTTGFRVRELRMRKGPGAMHYLSKPVTFWIAVMSLFSFMAGNMMGHEGWYVFWKSIFATYDPALITYQGTTMPIPQVPDPVQWAKYGGDQRYDKFSQAPKDLLIPYPSYISMDRLAATDIIRHRLFSQDFGNGNSHPGIDMTAPQGTPVVAALNGYVTKVAFEAGGFGNYIILLHPNVPDPRNPGKTTQIYTLYAHLDSTVADVGMIINKGDVIGTVGKTGNAGGFHLHFQMGYDEKQLWPFSSAEARAAGLSFQQAVDTGFDRERIPQYFANPMLYVQANYATVTIAQTPASVSSVRQRLTPAQLSEQRKAERVARLGTRIAIIDPVKVTTLAVSGSDSASSAVSTSMSSVSSSVQPTPVASVHIDVPYDFTTERKWQKVRITLRDANGDAIVNPVMERPIALRTSYGEAQFRPSVLNSTNFKNGVAEAEILPTGQRTVVVELYPLNQYSAPIRYATK